MLTLRDPLNQVRAAFAVTAVLVGVRDGIGPVLVILILLGVSLMPRLLRLPRPFEIALVIGLSLQVAGAVLGLFRPDYGWDILVHMVLTGAAGACTYMTLVRLGALPDPTTPRAPNHDAGVLVLTAALGITLGASWEIVEGSSDELFGTSLIRSQLDTTLDLLANTIGAVVGGAGTVAWARRQRTESEEAPLAGAQGSRLAD